MPAPLSIPKATPQWAAAPRVLLENAGLGNVSDLCIGGNYAVTPQFSVFLQLENILGRRYQIIPDLYSKAFHGMFGASYIF